MEITVGKVVSVVIALGYVVFAAISGGPIVSLKCGVAVLLPLSLIWFPDEIGSVTGYWGGHSIVDKESPGVLVWFMGWVILVGLPVGAYLLSRAP